MDTKVFDYGVFSQKMKIDPLQFEKYVNEIKKRTLLKRRVRQANNTIIGAVYYL